MNAAPSRNLARWCFFTLFVAPFIALLHAEDVEVGGMRFNSVRPASGGAAWLEGEVALKVTPASAERMVSRVRVTLTLGYELPATAGRPRRVEYYHAEAECVALEPGRSNVRFYLPPEVVKRDQLHGEPKFWVIELPISGRPASATRASAAVTLTELEARRSFLAAAALAAPANSGLLLPQYLTPFVLEYPRATPSFVRREPTNVLR